MKYISLLLLIAFPALFISCNGGKKEKIARLVEEWQGKTILFPEQIVFTSYQDTVSYRIPDAEYKILVYVDSIGCTSCKLQLPEWKALIRKTDSITGGKVPFLFFFHPKDTKELFYLLKRDRFGLPVSIDPGDRLNRLNGFPSRMNFQTFLLDRENRVVVIGNPVHNGAICDLYLKEITQNGEESGKPSDARKPDQIPGTGRIRTTAEAGKREISLGTFPKEEKKEIVVEIKNTGHQPLVVLDVSTTCGCLTAVYPKDAAPPGGSIRLTVKVAREDTGSFEDVLTVKCNTPEPIQIQINGKAE